MSRLAMVLFCFLGVLAGFFVFPAPAAGSEERTYLCRVRRIYPHNPADSTQGLVLAGNLLYESTGGYGSSCLVVKELASGRALRRLRLPPELFGEGLAVQGGWIFQLTWRSGRVFRYGLADFRRRGEHALDTEGWGLTSDGAWLILSDGSPVLRFYEPAGFRQTGRLPVFDHRGPLAGLNELEYVNGLIFANVYPTSLLVMIDPGSGRVVGRTDLGGLLDLGEAGAGVANGIAYDPGADRLLVTGKRWPFLFEIELVAEGE